MPPKPCPLRLKRLINRENALAASDPHPLRQIVRAFQARKHSKGGDTFAVQFLSDVTINFIDYGVSTRNDLADALDGVGQVGLDLIRECANPKCDRLFWAGRADRMACEKHLQQWSKREYRRKRKERETETKSAQDAKRKEREATKTLDQMNR